MKVLGISGSAGKDRSTAIIIGKVCEELSTAGIETELTQHGISAENFMC